VTDMTWRLQVVHTTRFAYDTAAKASYNEARLTPPTLLTQTTLESRIDIDPPAPVYRYHDYWATQVSAFDLDAAHDQLVVTATTTIETTASEPRLEPPVSWLVLQHPTNTDRFAEYLAPTARSAVDDDLVDEVRAHVQAQVPSGSPELSPTEVALCISSWVHGAVEYMPGATGVQTSAREAWQRRQGVCQDIAHLTAGLLRRFGIPARYVSGYVHPKRTAEIGVTVAGQSHAWVEWWDGEWVGHDVTNDQPIGVQHVVVARGRDYGDVAPLKGVYQGRSASRLAVTVEVTRLS
jgi:transglutaminase-like putative cysteine protease